MIESIKIKIGGASFDVPLENLKELYEELHKLFGKKEPYSVPYDLKMERDTKFGPVPVKTTFIPVDNVFHPF